MKPCTSARLILLVLPLLAATPALSHGESPTRAETQEADRLICRSRPKVGSRIARERDCRTAEAWRLYEKDLEQSRRDLGNGGLPAPDRNTGIFPCTPSQPC